MWNNARGFRSPAARLFIIPRFWILTLALLLLLRAPALTIDVLDPDEAGHAVNAGVWMDGGTPYVDFVDNKQPLVYLAFGLVFSVFGRSLIAVHALTFPWLLATAWLLGAIAASAWPAPRARQWAALLFVLGSSAYIEKDMLATNTEVLMNLPLVAGFWGLMAWRRRATVGAALVSGLVTGIALLFHLKAVLAVPALVFAVWTVSRERRGTRLVAWLAAMAAPPALALAWFWTRGALGEAWFWNVALNFKYTGAGLPLGVAGVTRGVLYGYPRLLLFMLATLPLWVAAVVSARRAWRDGSLRPTTGVALLWLAGSLGGACMGGRFYGHYFVSLVPPLAWLASAPLADLFARPTTGGPGRRRLLRILGFATLVLPVAGLTVAGSIRISRGYLDGLRPEVGEVARAVRAGTGPTDRIFVWGYWPQLYYYAGRPPATRFVFPQTLSGYVPGRPDYLDSSADTSHYIVDAHWRLWAADMERHPAELVIDTSPGAIHYWERYPMSRYPPLADLVARRYRYESTVAGVAIYRLRHEAGGPK